MPASRPDLSRLLKKLSPNARQQLVGVAVWAVIAAFCATGLSHDYGRQKSAAEARDQSVAETAAAVLARQSLERIVAGDRISLQLLAQELLALPAITGVTVQDVESYPLTQVGDIDRGVTVTAPVVLHDSLAGSVAINYVPGAAVHFPWASLLLCLVFALPVSAVAALAVAQLPARRGTPVLAPAPVKPAPETEPPLGAGLYLRPLNWAQLRNQLSRGALEKLEQQLRERLTLLCRIYDARPLKDAGPQQGLGFAGADAGFRAVCCGLLLRELQGSSAVTGLQLALAVTPGQLDDFSADRLLAQPRSLYLHRDLLEEPELADRIHCHESDAGLEVTALAPVYQSLLDNQLQQLAQA
ncbi:hypothetical protein AUP74_01233 [Microbulbifer aggregans]|uniref:Uncharacterized protein n=1 Tax=Microbulbifer aggregans TaxID=1769779 RepID=A0A1C9W6B9_9GAMM|nr:hypothetical protein [Microbulbifer aggregans]AOS96693.1 hypothetical protein AUP74_01233 [Microbulbifer aggregans]